MTTFGQTTAFSFGTPTQPASSPGLFGSSTFGAASTPAPFGAASTPAFGFGASTPTPAANTSPFGFGAPAASSAAAGFGTPAASPSIFGANSTPAFGALGKTTGTFGQTQAAGSPGLFGASTSVFGQPQPAPSLFGAAASSPAPAFGGSSFSFGAAAASAPGSAFNFAPAGQSQPSLFGAATTQQAGALALTTAQPGGLFGAQAAQPSSFGGTGLQPDAAIKEISETRNAYTPTAPSYKFHHLFLSVVDDPAQRVKPPNVDEMRWRQAIAQAGGPNNPDRLWPVLACGPKDLLLRAAAQQRAVEENQARLRSLTELSQKLSCKSSGELRQRSADVQKRHVELSHRLLQVARNLDALEGRLASGIGSFRGDSARQKEAGLAKQLAAVQAELAPASGSGLPRRLKAVASAVQLRSGGMLKSEAPVNLDENSQKQLFAVLKEHAEGVRQLQNVLKASAIDIEIMQQHMR